MRRTLYLVAAILAISSIALFFPSRGQAADLGVNKRQVSRSHYGPSAYAHRRYSGCPDRLSCSPMYGAYGPYGGQAYWSAYGYDTLNPDAYSYYDYR
jgi:hypothetical protein